MKDINADRPAETAGAVVATPDPGRNRPAYWAKSLTDEDAEWVRHVFPLQPLPLATREAA